MRQLRWPVVAFATLWIAGCGTRDPVQEMQKSLANAPEYMILLEDMREDGSFFTNYYHRYTVVQGERRGTTEWIEVSEEVYRKYAAFLGMALVAKSDEGVNNTPHPPGYHYVGNPNYGHWGGGGSFWVFYGQYALMRDLMGGGYGRQVLPQRLRRLSQQPRSAAAVLRAQPGVRYRRIGYKEAKAGVLSAPAKGHCKQAAVLFTEGQGPVRPQPVGLWQPQQREVWKMMWGQFAGNRDLPGLRVCVVLDWQACLRLDHAELPREGRACGEGQHGPVGGDRGVLFRAGSGNRRGDFRTLARVGGGPGRRTHLRPAFNRADESFAGSSTTG